MAKKLKPAYKRIVIKLSGEALQGDCGHGLDFTSIGVIAGQIKEVAELGVEVAAVVGGGNILRGRIAAEAGMDRAAADYMGMLATVINGLAIQDVLEKMGVMTRVMSAIEMQQLCEPYIRRRAMHHLKKGRTVIFAGGTENPYFSTDTAAALRAIEIGADVILKGTKVNGIYSDDPKQNASAKLYKKLRYLDVLKKGLKVMDSTSISLCMDNSLPMAVFNLFKKGNLKKIVLGEKIGTIVE